MTGAALEQTLTEQVVEGATENVAYKEGKCSETVVEGKKGERTQEKQIANGSCIGGQENDETNPTVVGKSEESNVKNLLEQRIAELEMEMYTGENGEKWLANRIEEDLKTVEAKVPEEGANEISEYWKSVAIKSMKSAAKKELKLHQKKTEIYQAVQSRANAELMCKSAEEQVLKWKALTRTLQKQRDEQDVKTKEVLENFQGSFQGINDKIKEEEEKRHAAALANEELRQNLQKILEQAEAQASHNAKVLEAKDLELQLSEAKLKQQQELARQESLKVQAYQEKFVEFVKREEMLRKELETYASKYEEFHETVTKSAEVIAKFKKDMASQASQIKAMNHENLQLKTKLEKNTKLASALSIENEQSTTTIKSLKAKISVLENLSRDLKAQLDNTKEA
eukprot:Nk52_evm46s215 gene=Nk52_evmTU46s215